MTKLKNLLSEISLFQGDAGSNDLKDLFDDFFHDGVVPAKYKELYWADDDDLKGNTVYHSDKDEKKTGMNKITKTRVGDDIYFYVNGVEDRGIVAKMSTTYITVFKEDGRFYDIPMNDTFHVSEILVNKTWDSMSMEERTEQLQKAHAYSPRFLAKSWADLPQELKDILKSDVEQGAYGTTGGRPFIGVSTQTPFDAEEDYEGQSHDDKSEEFKHEHKKPKTSMTGHGKKKE